MYNSNNSGVRQGQKSILRVEVEGQGHRFTVRVRGLPSRGGGRRGPVCGFSRKSRKRLLDMMASLDPRPVEGFRHVALFLTLTYPGPEDELPSPAVAKQHLFAFLKRLLRRLPEASFLWRFEWTSSGVRTYHPHFHILLFNVPYYHHQLVRFLWAEVVGFSPDLPATEVQAVRSWRGVLSYVAKYIAKECPPVASGCHAQADPRGSSPSEGADSGGSLVYGTYLSAGTGRVWGFYHREALPWAECTRVVIRHGDFSWLYRLRRLARRCWPGVGGGFSGFTLYVESPLRWFDAVAWAIG